MMVFLSSMLMIGNAILNPISRSHGYGRDVWRIPYADTAMVLKLFYIGGILYLVGVALTKCAFLCFYLKLFPSSTLRRIGQVLIALVATQAIVLGVLFIVQCSPVEYTWLQWDGEGQGKCLNFDTGAVAHNVLNIVFDLLIFAIPMSQVFQLNLSLKKRIQVSLMFVVGLL
jgi:hypothetical protein